ncbi:transporter substrate-binding domain-containing protein [uncultured Nitratireductor sp.]|uniref:transporter substrate-binding domain-containing protein n=1 Tax=uncultured Nitratireductor sp. TaxID=520953 RepID=UPI0025E86796|nr:transporter substrate-binding domain-containing protein [uncultured Nitratireductor sp.]
MIIQSAPVYVATALLVLGNGAAVAAEPSFASDGEIAVCTTANFPPLTFKQNAGDSTPVGIDVDLAEAIAEKFGATTSYTTTEFAGLLPSLGAGRCDLIISGIYINDERRESYDGIRYMRSATVMVTQADNDTISEPADLSGKTVALEAGSYYQQERIDPLNAELAEADKPEVEITLYPAQQGAYQQVLIGRAAATLTEEAEGAYRVAGARDQFRIAYTWKSDFTYGIYMRPSDTDAAAVRDTLKSLSADGFFDDLATKYGIDPAVFDVDYDS